MKTYETPTIRTLAISDPRIGILTHRIKELAAETAVTVFLDPDSRERRLFVRMIRVRSKLRVRLHRRVSQHVSNRKGL